MREGEREGGRGTEWCHHHTHARHSMLLSPSLPLSLFQVAVCQHSRRQCDAGGRSARRRKEGEGEETVRESESERSRERELCVDWC